MYLVFGQIFLFMTTLPDNVAQLLDVVSAHVALLRHVLADEEELGEGGQQLLGQRLQPWPHLPTSAQPRCHQQLPGGDNLGSGVRVRNWSKYTEFPQGQRSLLN